MRCAVRGDGFILSEGSVNAGMSTGNDLSVWAIGDVLGNYHAGRDASVITYADFRAAGGTESLSIGVPKDTRGN